MDFGTYIRSRREALSSESAQTGAPEFSLRAVARRLEIEASHLSKVELGRVQPSDAMIANLAAILGEDFDTLMLLAGRVSPELQKVVGARPKLFAELIRELRNAPDKAILRLVREVRDGQW
ncbi:helix-turn-helix domain-containing protein [Caballeronia glebae]|uniref:helix-turn-helix domain-containing protein n=1 Tax=Caballeronia glebae TaxID=1777143 RepID=UPI0038BAD859